MNCRFPFILAAALFSAGFLFAQPDFSSDDGAWGGGEGVQGTAEGGFGFDSVENAIEKAKSDEPIPLNQPIFLTEDQIQLKGIYYKGNADESTVPVLLIHGKDRKKEDWEVLAKKLAETGKSVLIPDLRGYGESTNGSIEDFSAGGDRPAVRPNEYTAENFTDDDYEAMRTYDGDLWYRFLIELHNSRKINIRKLVIVADGFGCAVAGSWIFQDWQANPKKGRFTRGLVMISPDQDPVFAKLAAGRTKAGSVMYQIYTGQLNEEKNEAAQKISLKLGKEKSDVPDAERKVKVVSFKTEKQGISLLKVESFEIPQKIIQFIDEECPLPEKQQKWQEIKTF